MLNVKNSKSQEYGETHKLLKDMYLLDDFLKGLGTGEWEISGDSIYVVNKDGTKRNVTPYVNKELAEGVTNNYDRIIEHVSKCTEYALESTAFISRVKVEHSSLIVNFSSGRTGKYARGKADLHGDRFKKILRTWADNSGSVSLPDNLLHYTIDSVEEDGNVDGLFHLCLKIGMDSDSETKQTMDITEQNLLSIISASLSEIIFRDNKVIAIYESLAKGEFSSVIANV